MRDELGRICIPAPTLMDVSEGMVGRGLRMEGKKEGERGTSAISEADSKTRTLCPARDMAIAAPKPPRPAPTMMTWFCVVSHVIFTCSRCLTYIQFILLISYDFLFHWYCVFAHYEALGGRVYR